MILASLLLAAGALLKNPDVNPSGTQENFPR